MSYDTIPYDAWIDEALRDVVRRVLIKVATEGLPGEHHFYVTFMTKADGVEMPGHLKIQHPDTMTIVLQHQFTNLEVEREFFSVSLKFGGKPEYLRIPLDSITSFADPSVNFSLQLKAGEEANSDDKEPAASEPASENVPEFAPPEKSTGGTPRRGTGKRGAGADDGEQKTGEVIALDAFRKK